MTREAKGALIEYGSSFLGPLPNVVVFQFNVEELNRQFALQRPAPEGNIPAQQRESHAASAAPVESFSLTLKFSAADDLNEGAAIATAFGPQIAALEKMVYPAGGGLLSKAIGAVVDAVGSALGGGDDAPTRRIPRETLPHILFVAGPLRVLPVEITSFAVKETLFDRLLQPISAEITVGLRIVTFPPDSTDLIGQGALEYMATLKESQAALNLGKAIQGAADIIPF
jgi:hypothetical protein